MRKDELLYLHQLLAVTRRDLERRDGVHRAFDDYESLSVSPMAAYAAKGDHERAVMTLARTLAGSIESTGTDDVEDRRQPVSP